MGLERTTSRPDARTCDLLTESWGAAVGSYISSYWHHDRCGSRNYLFVKVETDEGLYGMGEFGITWKEQAGVGEAERLPQGKHRPPRENEHPMPPYSRIAV